jgi:hypothetical protein
MLFRVMLLVAAALAASGCAPWVAASRQAGKLPTVRTAPDSAMLDVALVRLPAADLPGYREIWLAADEQVLPAELRQDLATNGLRAGVLSSELPPTLRRQLDARPNILADRSEDIDTSDIEIGSGKQRIPVRTGGRAEILASKTYPTLAVLLSEDGQVRGHQLSQAQCLFALKAYPQSDGRVKLDLTPEIAHGEHKSQWVRSDAAMMLRTGRDRLVLDRLRIEARLSPGEWLAISTTEEIKGLGEYFFAESAGGMLERTTALVRLAQGQADDLFAPGRTSAPLATPGE